MTIATDNRSHHIGLPAAGLLTRSVSLGYGIAVYAILLAMFLYGIGFINGLVVSRSIDTGNVWPSSVAFCIDIQLLGLFAIQYSGMARRGFSRLTSNHATSAREQSTYVLCASLVLILFFAAWQPLPAMVWQAADPRTAAAIRSLSLLGWLIAFLSTSSHFELFARKQVLLNFAGRGESAVQFQTHGLYRFVRHPIYLGFILAFWAAPVMTAGHFLFASVTTAYMFVGIWLEERGLVALFGDRYWEYRERVAMLLPGIF